MFTARKMFSNSFVASAALVELTGTVLTITWLYIAVATSKHAGVTPPTTFGMVAVL